MRTMELQRGLLTSAEGSMHVVEARLLFEGGQSISAETVWFTAMMPFITCSIAYVTSCVGKCCKKMAKCQLESSITDV